MFSYYVRVLIVLVPTAILLMLMLFTYVGCLFHFISVKRNRLVFMNYDAYFICLCLLISDGSLSLLSHRLTEKHQDQTLFKAHVF